VFDEHARARAYIYICIFVLYDFAYLIGDEILLLLTKIYYCKYKSIFPFQTVTLGSQLVYLTNHLHENCGDHEQSLISDIKLLKLTNEVIASMEQSPS
jgi:hypothetical protein